MVDCEKFTEILAAGEDAARDDRDAAREHAAVCEECRLVGDAFARFEGATAEVERAPAGFASRAVARLPLGERPGAFVPLLRWGNWPATWIGAGAATLAAAIMGGLVAYFAYTDPEGLAAAANAFTNMPAVDATTFGSIVGASAAAVAVAGFLAYYYLVPAD